MQIHELDHFTGALDTGAFLAVDNGSDTGKIAATELVADLDAEVSELDAYLNARIDNIIAGGAAPSEAEVVDARMGFNGKVYSSLGDAIRQQARNLNDDLVYGNAHNLLLDFGSYSNSSNNGVAITWDTRWKCSLTTPGGTATGYANFNIYTNSAAMPSQIEPGKSYWCMNDTNDDNAVLQIIYWFSGGTSQTITITKHSYRIDVPSNCIGLTVRIRANKKDVAYNAMMKIAIFDAPPNDRLDWEIGRRIFAKDATPYVNNGDITLSDITEDGFYILTDAWNVTDGPSGFNPTGLKVEHYSALRPESFIKQTVESLTSPALNKKYFRVSSYGGVFSDWIETVGAGTINNYTMPHYENTYNVSASPTITSDTNNYLASTGDTTDVTASILALLTANKVCHLGTGVFYVTDLEMPDDTMIIGSGAETKIILTGNDSATGFAIKLGSRCVVKDLTIYGSLSTITLSSDVLNRHGILWEGDANINGSSNPNIPVTSLVENVFIRNFKGGGITCYNTGYGTRNCITVSNCFISGCRAGINISYWSEFHRFTGVHVISCYYACINNGGNNMFVNCDFSGNTLGMLMDNSQSQSPNNTHGSAIGCIFNHMNENAGIGIKILNCGNGFIFSGCQIFYSQIYLEDSDGIVISNSNFGSSNCDITIDGGGAILFANNMHQAAPTINVTDNTKVHFVNCYNRSTGESIAA